MHLEVSLIVVGAVLTVVGYSLNDTIIIFDRVRENLHKYRRQIDEGYEERQDNGEEGLALQLFSDLGLHRFGAHYFVLASADAGVERPARRRRDRDGGRRLGLGRPGGGAGPGPLSSVRPQRLH